MSTIVTRAGKGSPLTNTELDSNFTNLNTDKAELSGANFTGSIDVTGSVVADGLTVANTGFARITLQDSDATNQKGYIDSSGGDLNLTSQNGTSHGDIFLKRYNGTSTVLSAQFAANGAISFYDGSGNQGLFWDSSASYLGLGTTTVNADLHISKTSGAKLWITAQGNNPSDAGSLRFAELNNGNNYFEFKHDGSSNTLSLNSTNGNLVTFNRSNQSTSFSGSVTADGNIESSDTFILNNGTDKWQNLFSTNDLIIRNNHNTSWYNRLRISYDGDISFYEDTGTTPKLTWDASAEKLNLSGVGGLDVTGTATMDGLSVVGNLGTFAVNTEGAIVSLSRPSTSYIRATNAAGSLAFDTGGSNRRLFLANNGDISFYDSSGSSQNLFWDSSTSRLGLGTTSPTHKLHTITSATGVYIQREISSNAANLSEFNSNRSLIIKNRTGGSFLMFGGNGSRTDIQATDGAGTPTAKNIALNPFGGNVGIGTATPLYTAGTRTTLTINGTGSSNLSFGANGTGYGNIFVASNEMNIGTQTSANPLKFVIGGAEKARLDSQGRVGIGTSSPSAKLQAQVNNTATPAQIATDSNAVLLLENTNASGSAGIRLRGGNGAGVLMYGENNSTDKFYLTPRNDTGKSFTLDHVGNGVFSGSVTIPDYVIHDGNTATKFGFPSANLINFITNGTERLVLAGSYTVFNESGADVDFRVESVNSDRALFVQGSDGQVNITNSLMVGSTTAPTDKLDVAGAIRLTGNISFDANKSGRIYKASNHGLAFHGVTGTENDFALFTSSGQLMVVNPTGTNNVALVPSAGGSVGIGTSSPSEKLSILGGHISVGDSSGVTGTEFLLEGYREIYNGSKYGNISIRSTYNPASNASDMLFYTASSGTNTAERTRIASNGTLYHGKTADSLNTGGLQTLISGQTSITQDHNEPLRLNRMSSQGAIQKFYYNGAEVGSIGSNSGYLFIGGTAGNDAFLSFGADGVRPATSAGAARDAAVDLGGSSNRFKDLYLSNNATAQKLTLTKAPVGTFTLEVDGTNTGQPNLIVKKSTSEALRIDNNNNLLVGTTSQTAQLTVNNGGNNYPSWLQNSSSSIDYPNRVISSYATGGQTATMFLFLAANGDAVGSIKSTVTTTSYNTTSDQRLKENIADADDAGSKIDAIQVRKYDWKADGSHQDYGMIAQELQTVAPEAVSGDADSEEMMGVDYSKLVPMLIKEIQSLRQRVAQLEE